LPDYKHWKAISSTDRLDDQTLRLILGSDAAIKAIAEHRTNPWPNSATFAKVAWLQLDDRHGHVQAGALVQVKLMIRDSKKYSATKGWEWARWRGGA